MQSENIARDVLNNIRDMMQRDWDIKKDGLRAMNLQQFVMDVIGTTHKFSIKLFQKILLKNE